MKLPEEPKDRYEAFKDTLMEEYKKGNIVFMGIEGPMVAPIDNFIEQPAEGLLYDLNRDEVTVLTNLKDQKWVNDYAVAKVIRKLKELQQKYNELIMAVKNKYPDETRHETALRYIKERMDKEPFGELWKD